MQYPVHLDRVIVGILLTLIGTLMYAIHRNHPERVRGITHRTFLRLCMVAMVGGLLVVLIQLIFPE